MTEADPNLFPFRDVRTEPDNFLANYRGTFDKDDNIIVIDNGNKQV